MERTPLHPAAARPRTRAEAGSYCEAGTAKRAWTAMSYGPARPPFSADTVEASSGGDVLTDRFRALPFTQSFQSACQKPQPLSTSSSRLEPVTTIGSPRWVRLKNHFALDGLMLMQPWLTFALPWLPTDQGALWTYSPLSEIRTDLYTVRLYPPGLPGLMPIQEDVIVTGSSFDIARWTPLVVVYLRAPPLPMLVGMVRTFLPLTVTTILWVSSPAVEICESPTLKRSE